MLEHAANAAHECAEGHALSWFACIDQCKDFGPYLLVLLHTQAHVYHTRRVRGAAGAAGVEGGAAHAGGAA